LPRPRNDGPTAENAPYDRLFRTDGLRKDLKRLTVRGGTVAVANHSAKVVLLVGSTMILARLLRPEDFGLVAMVTAFTGFANTFRDFGLSSATIQREDLRHEQVSRLFRVNLGISALLAVIIAAAAPVIAWFYGQPVLVGITLALATSSLLDGLGIQHGAMIRRQMRFGVLAAIDLGAAAAGATAALLLAWAGAGYWALVAQQLVTFGTRTALQWLASGWRPGAAAPLSEVRSLLAFGSHLTGSRTISYCSRNLDKVMVGKFWSADQLGFYSKALNAIVQPFQQASQMLGRVAVPTLSRLQDDPSRYRAYFTTAVLMVATAGLPAVAFLAVDAENLVRLLLGNKWLQTVPFLRILIPAAILEMVTMATRWIFISRGHSIRLLRWRLLESAVRTAALAAGLRWGPMGIAIGVGASSALLIVPALLYGIHGSPLRVRDFAATVWRPAVAALAGAAGLAALHSLGTAAGSPAATLAVDGPAFAALYLGVWWLLPGGRAALVGLLRLAKELRPSRGGRTA
jgi:O-antigen/teichoic acid export membrane protein